MRILFRIRHSRCLSSFAWVDETGADLLRALRVVGEGLVNLVISTKIRYELPMEVLMGGTLYYMREYPRGSQVL